MDTRALAATAARLETLAYAALRLVAGAMFAFHGAQKILGWLPAGPAPALGTQLWFGGIIELVGGTLIALGLFTRAAAFLASGTMAVAYTQFHWKLAVANFAWLPSVNKGELAALYCFLFLFVMARGPGPASLDAVLRGGARAR
ncbi:DoxX family protein [Anaeromyxobacter sp. Fw109-5]|uniref:DoxX family protein n=1 Tax=Anaeromyxobacter sp. (strain Fw109-5) TaxID=404589 RepID=UPI0000ED79E5|nr:DoxX family protein [Anaeromyxobacter sp. Fw109-5]ABS24790.1 DoxX family protein [Anaeromyxobacter sp. Fw109-5]